MSAIGDDAPFTDQEFADSGADAFMSMFLPPDAEKPSGSEDDKKKNPGTPGEEDAVTEREDDAEGSAEKPETDEEAEGSEKETEQPEKKYVDNDDVFVKYKVGDEEHEVSVKSLTRLAGQEQALTKKSMEVAEQRKTIEVELARNVAATNNLLDRAKKRFEPYSKIDFLLAAKELPADEYTNLRQAAVAAYEDVQFLEKGLNDLMTGVQKQQHDELVTKAQAAIKVLSGPVDQGGIEGWNEKLYDDIRSFAVTQGLDRQIVDNLVDPAALRLLNDAMLFRRGQSKVVTTKVNKTPKKVVKTTSAPTAATGGKDKSKVDAAMKRLRSSGSEDDAAEAFLASWESDD